MPDLAHIHHAVEEWSGHDPYAETLTEQQVADYWRDGFLIGVPVLTDAEVDRILADIDEVSDPGHEGREFWYEYNSDATSTGGTVQGIGGWRVRQSLHDLLWHPRITSAFAQIMNAAPRLLFDQLFLKPPGQSGVINWHQDYSYWTYSQPMNHVTCWVALDDADLSNGCVHYVPGSHKWELLQRPTKLMQDVGSIYEQLTPEQQAQFTPVPAEVKRGSVLFHHPLMIHGSHPNTSDRPRRGTTIHAMADGTRAAVDEPTIDGVPAWLMGGAGPFYPMTENPQGPLLEGTYFPLLRKV
ncbi:phytanoyl-CoA dioxygenase family protein [Nonomuraea wenchangensis]|uniref:phytanoyl-CoA dioxygenase family protein n=1 Tax=Nonomuraea wenchangensis TaxID=568860 RepID=UPI00384FD549